MLDEETGAEPRVVYASIADPFILLVRDDASVFIAKIFKNLELEELENEDSVLKSTKWATGCLYEDRSGIFAGAQSDKGAKADENIMMFLLSKAGALHVRDSFKFKEMVLMIIGVCFTRLIETRLCCRRIAFCTPSSFRQLCSKTRYC